MTFGLNVMFSVGSATIPYIISPFLTEITRSAAAVNYSTVYDASAYNTSQLTDNRDSVFSVCYAYVLVGTCCCVTGLPFLVIFIVEQVSSSDSYSIQQECKKNEKRSGKSMRAMLCIGLFLFFVLLCYTMFVPGTYIALFSVNMFNWSVDFGAMMSSVFFAAVGIGRCFAIPLSLFISHHAILNMSFVFVLLGYMIVLFAWTIGDAGVIAGLVIAGLGVGPLFGGIMVWIAKLVPFTTYHSAICTTGYSLGKLSAG